MRGSDIMHLKVFCMMVYLAVFATNVWAANTATPGAKEVYVETSCAAGQNDCFDNLGDLYNWIETVRKPNISSPLSVKIGNGEFLNPSGQTDISCNGQDFTGYISFTGKGVNNSMILLGVPGEFAAFFGVSGCEKMHFSNLTFRTDADYGYITWANGGSSVWNNVEVYGVGAAWKDGHCAEKEGIHYWYSSKLVSEQAFGSSEGYTASCDKSWLFGSEVTSIVQAGGDRYIGNSAGYNNAVLAWNTNKNSSNEPEIHLYGCNIRAISNDIVANSPTYVRGTVYAGSRGSIHIHGTGIDSISTVGEEIYVLVADNGGFIHANESSYVIDTTGSVTRIDSNNSIIKAPYVWEPGTTPPSIISENGADMFVETDCDSAGICDGVDIVNQRPHQMIYTPSCSVNGPWFDATINKCRQ